jgi:hypothetical protein
MYTTTPKEGRGVAHHWFTNYVAREAFKGTCHQLDQRA